jgi:chromosome segregation ATPase
MSKIDMLQKMLAGINKTITDLKNIIEEKTETIAKLEKQQKDLQSTLEAERIQLEEYDKKLQAHLEMRKETDSYYSQIEQNIETLMTILTTSR